MLTFYSVISAECGPVMSLEEEKKDLTKLTRFVHLVIIASGILTGRWLGNQMPDTVQIQAVITKVHQSRRLEDIINHPLVNQLRVK